MMQKELWCFLVFSRNTTWLKNADLVKLIIGVIWLGNVSFTFVAQCRAEEDTAKQDEAEPEPSTVEEDIGKSRDGSKTDDETVQREEEAIKLDGLNVAQMKELRDKAEKHAFQAEVSRMMKLIINSLYRNKEVSLEKGLFEFWVLMSRMSQFMKSFSNWVFHPIKQAFCF